MGTLAVSRKQRLRTLENEIRSNFEAFVTTGNALMEIRDDELYKEDGFKKWTHYLKERVGEEFGIESAQAKSIIQCAQIRPKLPEPIPATAVAGMNQDKQPEWRIAAVREFVRLAPKIEGNERLYDFRKLRKQDVTRVAKAAFDLAEKKGSDVTSGIVRACVDHDLGIDRSKKAKETKQANETVPKLEDYLRSKIGLIEGITENLTKVPADTWMLSEESDPGLAKRLAEVCDTLAELLRS